MKRAILIGLLWCMQAHATDTIFLIQGRLYKLNMDDLRLEPMDARLVILNGDGPPPPPDGSLKDKVAGWARAMNDPRSAGILSQAYRSAATSFAAGDLDYASAVGVARVASGIAMGADARAKWKATLAKLDAEIERSPKTAATLTQIADGFGAVGQAQVSDRFIKLITCMIAAFQTDGIGRWVKLIECVVTFIGDRGGLREALIPLNDLARVTGERADYQTAYAQWIGGRQ